MSRPTPALMAGSGRRRDAQRGSAVLYAIVLSPILLLSVALAVQLGAVQLQRQRVHSAVDQAAVVAAARDARTSDRGVALDPALAADAFRASLVDNLAPLEAELDGAGAVDVARAADVRIVTNVPAPDPFDPTTTLRRPTLEARVRVPLSSGLLRLAGVPSTLTLTLTSSADLRRTGGAGT